MNSPWKPCLAYLLHAEVGICKNIQISNHSVFCLQSSIFYPWSRLLLLLVQFPQFSLHSRQIVQCSNFIGQRFQIPAVCIRIRGKCISWLPVKKKLDHTHLHTLTHFLLPYGPLFRDKKKAMVASGEAAELILIEIGVGPTILGPTPILELLRWMCSHRWEPTPT